MLIILTRKRNNDYKIEYANSKAVTALFVSRLQVWDLVWMADGRGRGLITREDAGS